MAVCVAKHRSSAPCFWTEAVRPGPGSGHTAEAEKAERFFFLQMLFFYGCSGVFSSGFSFSKGFFLI